ncbi:U-box domain-containing protein 5-like [Chenopodium quinoa]|uniref:RING-type E3 ubiquitin transferase n=1 Tax=Chenopodium quinoa TaxID=63459 RepID=A0A803KYF6_CHEQI|nr:U-box domain-containing protein 5-like [Chenopodium quinoa]XP_021714534.1 U-box domain-containing protein 5-like [Chenopodium quinoa]
MGSDVSEVQEKSTQTLSIKVHISMCTQLLGLVEIIDSIIPVIEAAQPRCSLGLQALSHLRIAIEKARELVQNCCMSSKLYLAMTGETVKSRFEKAKNRMEQNLSQLQNMVPVALKQEMSDILVGLRGIKFSLDSCEELAGKALRAILQQDPSLVNSAGNSEIELLQFAASMLHLTTQKDLKIERRRLKNLLNDVKEEGSTKWKTLKYLLYLLNKYEKLIVQGQTRSFSTQHDLAFSVKSDSESITTQSPDLDSRADNFNYLRRPDPPEGFICPLSSRLMYDPVMISSGQTYERASIQKWFDEGHDTCPKTGMKLSNLSITPNTTMRKLILKWSMEYGSEFSDPSIVASVYGSLETSSNSIRSTASSMKDINLQIDISNLSLGSLDSSYSTISHAKLENSFGSIKKSSAVEFHRFQFYSSINDIRKQFLSNVRELPWESQCTAIQDVNTYLNDYNPSCSFVSSENFLDPLILFLEDALGKCDKDAQKAGIEVLSTFLQSKRKEPALLNEDIYCLLASFLATEAAAETLAIMELLSTEVDFFIFAASGALNSILKILDDSHKKDLQESALKLLYSLSSRIDSSSCNLAPDWIPILVPFLEDSSVAGTCLGILEKLCQFEETRISIAETQGCIASIIKVLEDCSYKDQEHAVRILLDLCSQREYFCQKVIREGCIPAVHYVSVKGSDKGKAIASELLRQLNETRFEEEKQECLRSTGDVPVAFHVGNDAQKSSKSPGFIRKLFRKK